jgi:hypothetical protein
MLEPASSRAQIRHNPPMGTSATTTGLVPTGQQLLSRETEVRRQGSGLSSADLLGCWQLQQVWPKGRSTPNALNSALLRGLGARLTISDAASARDLGNSATFAISNSVKLGTLELRFDGSGHLIGRRPLLQFSFSRLRLSLGPAILLERQLPPTPPKRLPFFALIDRDPSGWLAARGRGGGLALWRLAP